MKNQFKRGDIVSFIYAPTRTATYTVPGQGKVTGMDKKNNKLAVRIVNDKGRRFTINPKYVKLIPYDVDSKGVSNDSNITV